ncbi:2-hydroxy-6-oxo-6-phenylhexa-2,4-dienoate hydrolase [Glycine soja]
MLLLFPPLSKLASQTRLPLPFPVKAKVKLKVVSEADAFPSFLPKEVHRIKDPFARNLAMRIHRLPVSVRFSENPIMSSCVKPSMQNTANPVVLLHGFDSSCLEWRYTYPLLEEAGFETWAVDILGWGFSDLVAIDFAVNYPEAVEKLVLIDASVYAEGTGNLATLPRAAAYAGVYVLKSIPLRLYANYLSFTSLTFSTSLDWTNIGRLHCLLPWWEDATVDFMTSGGYNVASQIEKVKQKTLIIWGENDRIISNKLAVRLHWELADAIIRQIPDCGHLPHVERPDSVVKFIVEFVQSKTNTEKECVSPV